MNSYNTFDLQQVIRERLDEIDFEFGYPSVLKARCIEKAEMSGSDWEDILIEDYESDLRQMLNL